MQTLHMISRAKTDCVQLPALQQQAHDKMTCNKSDGLIKRWFNNLNKDDLKLLKHTCMLSFLLLLFLQQTPISRKSGRWYSARKVRMRASRRHHCGLPSWFRLSDNFITRGRYLCCVLSGLSRLQQHSWLKRDGKNYQSLSLGETHYCSILSNRRTIIGIRKKWRFPHPKKWIFPIQTSTRFNKCHKMESL